MAKVKVISLLQPWATLVVMGKKTIETRSWDTKYRGDLLIHASKKFTKEQAKLCRQWPFSEYIDVNHFDDLGFGMILGSATLLKTETSEERLRYMQELETEGAQEEFRFGDYSPGRFCWLLSNAIEFNEMIPAKGSLGLWDFEINHPLIHG